MQRLFLIPSATLESETPKFCFNWVPTILNKSADALVKWASRSFFSGSSVAETLPISVSDVVALERVSSCCTV